MTIVDLKVRKEIWCALSTLFLDTEVCDHYEELSQICANSAYSLDEIQEMLFNEVAPVCMPNLLSVAGEWTGFDEDWLVEGITEHLNNKPSALIKLFKPRWNLIARLYIGKQWKELVKLITEKRNETTA